MSQQYVWPSLSVTASNPSVGTVGSGAPTSATLVGGKNGANLLALALDSSGNIVLSSTSSTVKAQLQDNAGTAITLGQKVMASSLPVVIASDQSTVQVASANLELSQGSTTLGQKGPLLQAAVTTASPSYTTAQTSPLSLTTAGALRVDASATTQPVSQSGTWNINNISGTVSLPTGAATSALQTTGNSTLSTISSQLPSTLGAHVTSASLSVNIASDQTVPVSAASLPLPSGAATSANQTNVQSAPGVSATTAITVQGSASGVAVPVSAASLPLPTGAATSANQTTANTSLSTIATNTNNLGNTIVTHGTAFPTWALQIGVRNGSELVAITEGQSTMANSLPVTIASDQSSITTTPNSSKGRSSANAPVVTSYSSTNITSGAYVQLVASTSNAINLVEIFDSSGVALYFSTGGSGSEVIQFVIVPGGQGQVPLSISAGTRIAIKAVSTSATSGQGIINFYG